jgi:hypothetical protein
MRVERFDLSDSINLHAGAQRHHKYKASMYNLNDWMTVLVNWCRPFCMISSHAGTRASVLTLVRCISPPVHNTGTVLPSPYVLFHRRRCLVMSTRPPMPTIRCWFHLTLDAARLVACDRSSEIIPSASRSCKHLTHCTVDTRVCTSVPRPQRGGSRIRQDVVIPQPLHPTDAWLSDSHSARFAAGPATTSASYGCAEAVKLAVKQVRVAQNASVRLRGVLLLGRPSR